MKFANKLIILCLIPVTLFISIEAFRDSNSNLIVAKKIYNEFAFGEKYIPSLASEKIIQVPQKLRESILKNPAEAEIEIFKAYCALTSVNTIIYDNQIREVLELLIDNNNPKYFAEFLKISNPSENIVFSIYHTIKNPSFQKYFSNNNCKSIFKSYTIHSNAFYFANIKFESLKPDKIEKIFYYIGINNFNMPWKINEANWNKFGFPAIAYLAKLRGYEKIYNYYKQKSLSKQQFKDISAGIFEYSQYAAKVFALCGEPDISVAIIDSLPDGDQKSGIIKRTIRTILSAKGGLNAVNKSKFGKCLR